MFGLFSCEFNLPVFTNLINVFLKLDRLPCHCRLICGELNRLEAESVNRDVHTVFHHNDIANMKTVVVNYLNYSISKDSTLNRLRHNSNQLETAGERKKYLALCGKIKLTTFFAFVAALDLMN
jgi:hypothetical protein